jgi:hypothetical protein
MSPTVLTVLDGGIIAAASASAWLWWMASTQRMRRIDRSETLDAADLNRIITALNRMQIRSSRAAIATALAAGLAGLRWALAL